MRWALLGLALLTVGCKKTETDQPAREQSTGTPDKAGPDVGPTQLPGVSLTYQYGFRLPIERVASVQEQHAAQCEALTPVRCRITGMTYEVGRNRTITAMLQLKLAPETARSFGRQGIATVVAQGGMLADARIDSEETGATAAAANRDMATMAAGRREIADQLAKPGLSSAERTQLQARMAELSDTQRQTQAVRSDTLLKLASTPMTFNYESGDVDPGLTDGPIVGALKDGWANIVTGSAIILQLLITILPWIAATVLVVWLWRRFGERLGLRNPPGE